MIEVWNSHIQNSWLAQCAGEEAQMGTEGFAGLVKASAKYSRRSQSRHATQNTKPIFNTELEHFA